jgi:hypothetical protein
VDARRRRAQLCPWWERFPFELLRLQQRFPTEYGRWDGTRVGRALVLRGDVDVPTLPKRRRVAICFPGPPSRVRPIVMVSGPRESRHRFPQFRPTSLCLYYGPDPKSMRWHPDDGLVGLIDLIREHLFKEEWWRATRHWPGPEVHLRQPPARLGATPRGQGPTALLRLRRQPCWCGAGRYVNCHEGMSADDELKLLGIDTNPPAVSVGSDPPAQHA